MHVIEQTRDIWEEFGKRWGRGGEGEEGGGFWELCTSMWRRRRAFGRSDFSILHNKSCTELPSYRENIETDLSLDGAGTSNKTKSPTYYDHHYCIHIYIYLYIKRGKRRDHCCLILSQNKSPTSPPFTPHIPLRCKAFGRIGY